MAIRVNEKGTPSSRRSGRRNGLKVTNGKEPVIRQPAASVESTVSTKRSRFRPGRDVSLTSASGTARIHTSSPWWPRKGV
jgi:hypothetical protein